MRVEILSAPEVEVLLSFLDNCPARDALLFRLMLQCGLRIGEVATLNVENVWRQGYVHPAVNLPKGTTKRHIARYVDIPFPLRSLIAKHVEIMLSQNTDFSSEAPLFTGKKIRQRLGVSGIGRIVTSISQRALGRSIHPHVLRHTYATILLKYTNLRVVQQLLGHARVGTTEIYTHPTSEDCKAAVNKAFDR